ncbi:uncharacterized protein ACHE_60198S [Aspergillus chevalieri]|uniref:ORC6 first cyclin-like domain-containing protein n=1 Tax=Aspergillus chevalieri TaxID=182096 RepID=A0A7R7VT37_ASPCH|nr:uncharacterized protein ACHE_60198S [Aspergillus chevalieri]BCR90312.1 hypothetical protein ACHE_60198S [Aspergillus chevalieri]
MNNRPVEQALNTLLPTHANDLPPELVSLASSLVAQSRSFSASLKPEEEIARPYACAEIACRRLGRALRLPPLLGHPPCPPRVYKKLYSFLDRSLGSSTAAVKHSASGSAPGTPTRAGSNPSTPTKDRTTLARTPSISAVPGTPRGLQNTPSKPTPLKRAVGNVDSSSHTRTPQRVEKKIRPNGLPGSTIVPDAPGWVMASIRTVCKTLSTPAPRTSTWSRPPISKTFPPHMFAGASSILYFISKTSSSDADADLDEEMLEFLEPVMTVRNLEKDEDFKEMINALVVAIYFLVLARRRNPVDADGEQNGESKKLDKKTFSEMRQTALVSLGFPANERRHRADVDQWIALIMEQNWAHGQEWFENIPQAGELDGEEEYESDDVAAGEGDTAKRPKTGRGLLNASRKGLLPGLGTMMQDRVDWLSEDRQEDYLEWKADIMGRIEQVEGTGRVGA